MTLELYAGSEEAEEELHSVLEDHGFEAVLMGDDILYEHSETDSRAYLGPDNGSAYVELSGMRAHEMKELEDDLKATRAEVGESENNGLDWLNEDSEPVDFTPVDAEYDSGAPK